MNREILFRGFHADENGTEIAVVNGKEHKGKWVYGGAFKQCYKDNPPQMCIITPYEATDTDYDIEVNDVIPETVGQFTGLKDKNGKKIFDKDKIIYGERIDYDLYKESVANPEEYNGIIFDKGIIEDVVVWCGENGYPAFDLENHDMDCNALSEISAGDYCIEVIGTVFDKEE